MSAALAFGEELAGVVVAVMYAGGQYLESFAERRAGSYPLDLEAARTEFSGTHFLNGNVFPVPVIMTILFSGSLPMS